MRTETNPTENVKEWKPFGEKVEPKKAPDAPEWQPSPDAPGVEINWKTGMRRTNMRVPNAWVDDLAMQAKDEPVKPFIASASVFVDYIPGVVTGGTWRIVSLMDEQSAFEDWLNRERPSGDVESVQYQWVKSSDYSDYQDSLCP